MTTLRNARQYTMSTQAVSTGRPHLGGVTIPAGLFHGAWSSVAMHVPDLRFGHAPLPAAAPGYDPTGDALALMAPGTPSPATAAIPGLQDFDSLAPGHRFVVRIPQAWNGDLVVCGTPAMRSECANDAILCDFLLTRGYAFAASNKGIPYNAVIEPAQTVAPIRSNAYVIPFDLPGVPKNTAAIRLGALTPAYGATSRPGMRTSRALTRAAKERRTDAARAGAPARTYAVGLSLGGSQVRWLLERHPELVDGGVEWASVYWHPDCEPADVLAGVSADTCRPTLRAHTATAPLTLRSLRPAFRLTGSARCRAHQSLWDDHYRLAPYYADLTTFAFAKLLDPESGPLDTLESRAAYVPSAQARARIATFTHTGALGRPLIGIAGECDVFVTPQHHAMPYLEAVHRAGCAARYRQYVVTNGTHVDAYAAFGYGVAAAVAVRLARVRPTRRNRADRRSDALQRHGSKRANARGDVGTSPADHRPGSYVAEPRSVMAR